MAASNAVEVCSLRVFLITARSRAVVSCDLNVVSLSLMMDGVPDTLLKSLVQWTKACRSLERLVPIWNLPSVAVLLDQSEDMASTFFSF